MKKIAIKITSLFLLCFALSMTPVDLSAQCPMCRMAVESNLENGGTAGKGLNKGILYMLATPYFLIGGIGVLWYVNRKREDKDEEDKK